MTSFEFATANRIIFGAGKLNGLGVQLKGRAKRLLLVRGKSSDAIPRIRQILSAQDIPFMEFEVHGERHHHRIDRIDAYKAPAPVAEDVTHAADAQATANA